MLLNCIVSYNRVLEPTPEFFTKEQNDGETKKLGMAYMLHYFKPYKVYFVQLALGMLLSSVITLLSPMLTQAMIDKGVNMHNTRMVYLVLFAQLAVFCGSILIQFIQTKILLHVAAALTSAWFLIFFINYLTYPFPFSIVT
jgi:ATP-binding cassette subfamily B protein